MAIKLRNIILHSMTKFLALSFRKNLSYDAGIAAMSLAPLLFGLAHAQQVSTSIADTKSSRAAFDVASIKPSDPSISTPLFQASIPGNFSAIGITVKDLIEDAYDIRPFQVMGEPSWADSERYDVTAKVVDASHESADRFDRAKTVAALQAVNPRLRSLLADRFQLKTHTISKQMPIYALVAGKNGTKLHSGQAAPSRIDRGLIKGHGVPINVLISNLSPELGHILVDKTGLTGYYDIDLKWTPDDAPKDDSSGPSLRTALEEQLGLKLESQKGSVMVVVVDHVAKPLPN